MGEKLSHFFFTHLPRMPFIVKKDKTFDPIGVCLLGPDAIMPEPNRIAYLVEEFRFAGRKLSR